MKLNRRVFISLPFLAGAASAFKGLLTSKIWRVETQDIITGIWRVRRMYRTKEEAETFIKSISLIMGDDYPVHWQMYSVMLKTSQQLRHHEESEEKDLEGYVLPHIKFGSPTEGWAFVDNNIRIT